MSKRLVGIRIPKLGIRPSTASKNRLKKVHEIMMAILQVEDLLQLKKQAGKKSTFQLNQRCLKFLLCILVYTARLVVVEY
jgi:hypothetical protein